MLGHRACLARLWPLRGRERLRRSPDRTLTASRAGTKAWPPSEIATSRPGESFGAQVRLELHYPPFPRLGWIVGREPS